MISAPAWQPSVPSGYQGPRIALIHGLMAGSHMQRHLLHFLREAGYVDSTLYSNHLSPARIARDLAEAARAGRPIALIGYSQGGFQVLKVARLLEKQGLHSDLVVSAAAGGAGRFYPPQWGFGVRRVPASVRRYLNYFAARDLLGTDLYRAGNFARAGSGTHMENIAYPEAAGVDHFSIVRCYPAQKVLPEVRTLFLERLLNELAALNRA